MAVAAAVREGSLELAARSGWGRESRCGDHPAQLALSQEEVFRLLLSLKDLGAPGNENRGHCFCTDWGAPMPTPLS